MENWPSINFKKKITNASLKGVKSCHFGKNLINYRISWKSFLPRFAFIQKMKEAEECGGEVLDPDDMEELEKLKEKVSILEAQVLFTFHTLLFSCLYSLEFIS